MDEIGSSLKEARLDTSISLEEVSKDTSIPLVALEQIEDGSIGSFKDIFELKDYLKSYAKYLGLDSEKIINEFNEYMFEYTSKIPVSDLEKAIVDKEKLEETQAIETNEIKVVSPYLKTTEKSNTGKIILITILSIIVITIILVMIIKQIIIG